MTQLCAPPFKQRTFFDFTRRAPRPLLALTDNWTGAAASGHTIQPATPLWTSARRSRCRPALCVPRFLMSRPVPRTDIKPASFAVDETFPPVAANVCTLFTGLKITSHKTPKLRPYGAVEIRLLLSLLLLLFLLNRSVYKVRRVTNCRIQRQLPETGRS